MKKIKIILLYLFLAASTQAQTLTFSDPHLLEALIDEDIDENEDGKIQSAEALAITELDVDDKEIVSLAGMEAFQNLEIFYCNNNLIKSLTPLISLKKLTELYFSHNEVPVIPNEVLLNLTIIECTYNKFTTLSFASAKKMEDIDCSDNPLLVSLNVAGLTQLQHINFNDCAIATIDLKSNIELSLIKCSHNKLAALNLLINKKLEYVDCSNNKLTSLQVSNLSLLNNLICSSNLLTSISLKGLSALSNFEIAYNKLTTIDLSDLSNVYLIAVNDNQLTSLDVRPCTKLGALYTSSNAPTFKIIR